MSESMEQETFRPFSDIGLPFNTILHKEYQITEYLAQGHVNLVYLAERKEGTKVQKVLIKEFCPYDYANRDLDGKTILCKGNAYRKQYEEAKEVFQRECLIHERIHTFPEDKRKNIVKYIESFYENGTKYLVLEYIEGQDLSHFVKENRNVCFQKIAKGIVSAIMQIHKMGIVHKDLKPSNIVIGEEEKVSIIDFGAADFSHSTGKESEIIFVSKGFSAPELYQKKPAARLTDIYSVGAIFYYLLTGMVVESADMRMCEDDVLPLSEYLAVPCLLEYAIMKCLALDRKKRWKSMQLLYMLLL